MNVSQICRDETLYGHALTSLPHKLWTFSNEDFCFYEHPDPGTLVVIKDYIIMKDVYYRKGRSHIIKTEVILQKPLLDSIEFVVRRVLGSCATAVSCLTALPIGFAVKVLHVHILFISEMIQSLGVTEALGAI